LDAFTPFGLDEFTTLLDWWKPFNLMDFCLFDVFCFCCPYELISQPLWSKIARVFGSFISKWFMKIVDSLKFGFIKWVLLTCVVFVFFCFVFFVFWMLKFSKKIFKKKGKAKLVELNFHYRNKIFQNLLNFFIKKWQNFTPKNTHKTCVK